jgi:hypothetical protein
MKIAKVSLLTLIFTDIMADMKRLESEFNSIFTVERKFEACLKSHEVQRIKNIKVSVFLVVLCENLIMEQKRQVRQKRNYGIFEIKIYPLL